jgi:hypothetical protein
LALVVWTRPEVQELPLPRAVMSRLPLPSRWTLEVELVIVSISPVPKLAPAPVSYIHWESTPDPAEPLKSSLKTVDQPAGGPGTAATAATDAGAAGPAGAARAEAAGTVAAASAITGAMMRNASPPLGRHLMARSRTLMTHCDLPAYPGLLNPLQDL